MYIIKVTPLCPVIAVGFGWSGWLGCDPRVGSASNWSTRWDSFWANLWVIIIRELPSLAAISLRSTVALVGTPQTLGGAGGCRGQTSTVVGWVFTTTTAVWSIGVTGSYARGAIFVVHVDQRNVHIAMLSCRTTPSVQIVPEAFLDDMAKNCGAESRYCRVTEAGKSSQWEEKVK